MCKPKASGMIARSAKAACESRWMRSQGGIVMLFRKKTKQETVSYDRENEKPVLKCSICNGEQVAGFKNIQNGCFHEVMFIRNEKDLQDFKERYGIAEEIAKEY